MQCVHFGKLLLLLGTNHIQISHDFQPGYMFGHAKLASYSSMGSLLPPTDLASTGHEDQGGGLSCVVVYIEAEQSP